MTGRIVILNGAPRSGKTTLARAVQAHVRRAAGSISASTPSMPPCPLR